MSILLSESFRQTGFTVVFPLNFEGCQSAAGVSHNFDPSRQHYFGCRLHGWRCLNNLMLCRGELFSASSKSVRQSPAQIAILMKDININAQWEDFSFSFGSNPCLTGYVSQLITISKQHAHKAAGCKCMVFSFKLHLSVP